jgi:hypothetical protein
MCFFIMCFPEIRIFKSGRGRQRGNPSRESGVNGRHRQAHVPDGKVQAQFGPGAQEMGGF